MSYSSINFLIFVGITMLLYFLFPVKKQKWTVLLLASYAFYLLAGYKYVAFILFTTISTFFAALCIEKISDKGKEKLNAKKDVWNKEDKKNFKSQIKKRKISVMALTLILNFGILVFLKYSNMLLGSINGFFNAVNIGAEVPLLSLVLPLGISFYTFQSMGYIVDVYRGTVSAEKNIAKFALFVSFFPQIVQGPISIYSQLAHQLYEPHNFDFARFKHGAELILWGFFKKLVIADRAVVTINAAIENYSSYNGTTLTVVILLYAIQLYADFSAGIDISRGVAQIFGIDMIDNFKQPYFAISISDYWHRWHISLGEWFKTYLFYPLAMSKAFTNISKKIKKSKFGKTKSGLHLSKVLPTSLASFFVFFLVGVWHGPNWKYVAFGVWNGFIIMISALLKPQLDAFSEKLKINTSSFGFRIFRIFRTFLAVYVGYVFDVAPDFSSAMTTFKRIVINQNISDCIEQLESLELGISRLGIVLLGFSIMMMVDIIHERNKELSVRKELDTKPFIVRYALIVACILFIAVFGIYGPSYNPANFVYMQF